MRHYMVDPDNEERLLKIPLRVVTEIKAEALNAAVQRIEALAWTSETWSAHAERAAIIAEIRGDQR